MIDGYKKQKKLNLQIVRFQNKAEQLNWQTIIGGRGNGAFS